MQDAALLSILSTLPLPAVAIGKQNKIIAANEDALNLLGAQIVQRHYISIFRQPALRAAIEQTLKDGVSRMAQFVTPYGSQDSRYEVSCRASGNTVILCFNDVTHVAQTSQMRRDFVANVSHELRTPLTALMGFIETLKGPAREDPAAQTRFLAIMQSEAERMNRLVGDLLSLSHVESDERVRPTDVVCLDALLLSTIHSIKPVADDAQVEIETDFNETGFEITGDSDQLRQVFTNLIENAIKYGGSGGQVTVVLSRSDHEAFAKGPCARIEIVDYGDGIDQIHLPRLTERFYRVDDHRSRALGGTGLGLAITKHIINRHRGRLRVASTLGEGAKFSVILPIHL